MSTEDFLYIVTELDEAQVLNLLMQGGSSSSEIKAFSSEKRFFMWAKTDYYSVSSEKVGNGYKEIYYEDFGIRPTIELMVSYKDHHFTDGHKDILLRVAHLISQIKGDIVFLHDGLRVLKRVGTSLKLLKNTWNPSLLKLMNQEYELDEGINIF